MEIEFAREIILRAETIPFVEILIIIFLKKRRE